MTETEYASYEVIESKVPATPLKAQDVEITISPTGEMDGVRIRSDQLGGSAHDTLKTQADMEAERRNVSARSVNSEDSAAVQEDLLNQKRQTQLRKEALDLARAGKPSEEVKSILGDRYPELGAEAINRACEAAQKRSGEEADHAKAIAGISHPEEARGRKSVSSQMKEMLNSVASVAAGFIDRVGKLLNPQARQESTAIAAAMMESGQVTGIQNVSAEQLRRNFSPDVTPQLAKQAVRGMSAN